MKVAILDADQTELSLIKKSLNEITIEHNNPKDYTCFSSGIDFINYLRTGSFDLLVLDWFIPDFNGEDILKWMLQYRNIMIPTIVLSHLNDESLVVKALDLGASDFLTKPFRANEFRARVRKALRTGQPKQLSNLSNEVYFGDVVFLQASREVLIHDKKIELTEYEFNLALLLFNHIGSSISRSHIMNTVWKRNDPDFATRSLDVFVFRVRKKLNLTSDFGWSLSSVYGYGYRLERK